MKELIIYCDESSKDGEYYSNFYGGALVKSIDQQIVIDKLKEKKEALNFHGEVKWSKITAPYVDKYISLLEVFFDFIEKDIVKIRVMFTQNAYEPRHITKEQREQSYYLLYYQFIKHAFGVTFFNPDELTRLRIIFDKLPENNAETERFKAYIAGLTQTSLFKRGSIIVTPDDISDVDSRKHVILQCADIILGSMDFRLNNKHTIIPQGSTTRGKRTIAKEKVYRYINQRIRGIYPNFNIGITTATRDDISNRWYHPYRHWNFRSSQSTYNPERTKKKK